MYCSRSTFLIAFLTLFLLCSCRENPEAPTDVELEYDIALLSPMAYDVFLAGSTIQVHWVPREGYRAPDSVVIELRAYGGTEVVISSRPIPFNDGAVQYTLPDDDPERFFLRLRGSKHETAILRLENFPPAPVIGRGSLLEIDFSKAYSGDSPNTPPTYLLSTDGGQSWPFSGGLEKQFVTFPASDNCLLRLTHPDIPFEDTSATFTVVDDLETIPYLRVGQVYVYQTILVEWQRQAGGWVRVPYEQPDLHMFVQEKDILPDKILHTVLCWQAGRNDSTIIVVEEERSGFHAVSTNRDWVPFRIPYDPGGILVHLDRNTQEFSYKKTGCCDIVLDRERGLRLYRQYAMGGRYEYNWFLR